jgi:hypothetical protein
MVFRVGVIPSAVNALLHLSSGLCLRSDYFVWLNHRPVKCSLLRLPAAREVSGETSEGLSGLFGAKTLQCKTHRPSAIKRGPPRLRTSDTNPTQPGPFTVETTSGQIQEWTLRKGPFYQPSPTKCPLNRYKARVAELADAPDLGSGTERCVGSNPSSRTY